MEVEVPRKLSIQSDTEAIELSSLCITDPSEPYIPFEPTPYDGTFYNDFRHYQVKFRTDVDRQKYLEELDNNTQFIHLDVATIPVSLLEDKLFFFSWIHEFEGEYVLKFRSEPLEEILLSCDIEVTEDHGKDLSFLPQPFSPKAVENGYDMEKYAGVITNKSFSYTAVKAILFYMAGNKQRVEEILKVLDAFLAFCMNHEHVWIHSYIKATQYLVSRMKILIGHENEDAIEVTAEEIENDNKALAYLSYTKSSLASLFYKQEDPMAHHVRCLMEAIRLDPENEDWQASFYLRVRCKRRDRAGPILVPSADERKAAMNAYKYALCHGRLKNILTTQSHFLQCICEYANHYNRPAGDMFFGEAIFHSRYEALRYVANEAKKAVNSYFANLSSDALIEYGDTLSLALPPTYADINLAEQCLLKAMEMKKVKLHHSKVYHRLGLFYLRQGPDSERHLTAVKYLEEAESRDNQNFPAIMCLLKSYIRLIRSKSGREYSNRFKAVFKRIESTARSIRDDHELYTVSGLYHLATKNYLSAINAWTLAIAVEPSTGIARKVNDCARKFHFEFDREDWSNIIHTISRMRLNLKGGAAEEKRQNLTSLLSDIQNYELRANSHDGKGNNNNYRRAKDCCRPITNSSDCPNWRENHRRVNDNVEVTVETRPVVSVFGGGFAHPRNDIGYHRPRNNPGYAPSHNSSGGFALPRNTNGFSPTRNNRNDSWRYFSNGLTQFSARDFQSNRFSYVATERNWR